MVLVIRSASIYKHVNIFISRTVWKPYVRYTLEDSFYCGILWNGSVL